MRVFLLTAFFWGALALPGCTMIPAYERPLLPVPDSWPAGAETPGDSSPDNIGWRDFFEDETTRALIAAALANNRDLGVALLNIQKARAMYRIQGADLLPTVNLGGSSTNQRMPDDLSASGEAYVSRQHGVPVGFTAFELDLFGRSRSLKESALQSYFATEEAAKSTRISLVAEVAAAYLQLTADREILSLAQASHENRKEVHDLVAKQFEFGIASELAVHQARTGVEEARVMAAQYKTIVAQDENALVLLLGSGIPPEAAPAEKLADIAALRDLSPGMPSELILRRPWSCPFSTRAGISPICGFPRRTGILPC
jgi:multidrug efflux system outer membrane protein